MLHISQVNHHGNTKAWSVKEGILTGTQEPAGNGGILLTDKKYKDFEVLLEIKPGFSVQPKERSLPGDDRLPRRRRAFMASA
jgi:hypothetical protein